MQSVHDFLKKAGTYFIATVDGDAPRVRPFGTIHLFEGKLYIQTGKKKDFVKQLMANPKVELSACVGETWIRVAATLVEDDRAEAQESLLGGLSVLARNVRRERRQQCGILFEGRHRHILQLWRRAAGGKILTSNAYCAFLRGVNLNGRRMKMAEVCEVFRSAGMEQVSSVLATGNIIFTSQDDKTQLCGTLEAAMQAHFQMDCKLFIKEINEIKSMLEAVPYSPDPDWHIYTFICDTGFESVLNEEFQTAAPGNQTDESATVSGGTFFWHVRKGETLNTPFSKVLGNRKLKDKFTSRNIGTLMKIRDKGCAE